MRIFPLTLASATVLGSALLLAPGCRGPEEQSAPERAPARVAREDPQELIRQPTLGGRPHFPGSGGVAAEVRLTNPYPQFMTIEDVVIYGGQTQPAPTVVDPTVLAPYFITRRNKRVSVLPTTVQGFRATPPIDTTKPFWMLACVHLEDVHGDLYCRPYFRQWEPPLVSDHPYPRLPMTEGDLVPIDSAAATVMTAFVASPLPANQEFFLQPTLEGQPRFPGSGGATLNLVFDAPHPPNIYELIVYADQSANPLTTHPSNGYPSIEAPFAARVSSPNIPMELEGLSLGSVDRTRSLWVLVCVHFVDAQGNRKCRPFPHRWTSISAPPPLTTIQHATNDVSLP